MGKFTRFSEENPVALLWPPVLPNQGCYQVVLEFSPLSALASNGREHGLEEAAGAAVIKSILQCKQ
jgi:hypothetical protein